MAIALNPEAQISAAVNNAAAKGGDPKDAKLQAAARQFESVLLTQLLQVLWKSSPELSHGQGAMYQSMFQSSFADQLAESGGIGLADIIAGGLGAKTSHGVTGITRHFDKSLIAPSPAPGALPAEGTVMAAVDAAADGMLADGGLQWSKAGQLTAADLGTVNAGADAGERARRTISSAHGYQGYYKCNLFAFELARRAGLDVPHGLPSSNQLAMDASDGSLTTGWAKVATGASPAAMQDALHTGEAAFLLVGQGHGERHGHMAIIEKPRSIDYDEQGKVRSISFDGWEAQPDGAKHLTTRTWNRTGIQGARGDRNGLDRIEIIQLNRTGAEATQTRDSQVRPTLAARIGLK
jgi:Rod binding domain-containing protein